MESEEGEYTTVTVHFPKMRDYYQFDRTMD